MWSGSACNGIEARTVDAVLMVVFVGIWSACAMDSKDKDVTIQRDTSIHAFETARAYLNVRRKMPLLWTSYDHPETSLPNINNAFEGFFAGLMTKFRVHGGISWEHRKKSLDE